MSNTNKAPLSGIVLTLLAGLIAAAILSPIYAYATYYIPWVYLNAIFAILFAIVLGSAIASASTWGKLRTNGVIFLIALIVALFAEYTQWVSTIYVYVERLVVSPSEVIHLVQRFGEDGLWSLNNTVVNGTPLYIIWLLEAAILIGGSLFTVHSIVSERIFCETCSKWIKEPVKVLAFEIPNDLNGLLDSVRADSLDALLVLPQTDLTKPYQKPYLVLDLYACEGCQNLYLLTLSRMEYTTQSDGEVNKDKKTLVDRMQLSESSYKKIRDFQ